MLGRWDRWTFYRDRRGEWRWSRHAGTQLVGKSTEGYEHLHDCEANAARLGWNCRAWPRSARHDRWELYLDRRQRWRWRRQARNGEIVGAAHVGFVDRAACEANARRHGWQSEPGDRCRSGPASADWVSCSLDHSSSE